MADILLYKQQVWTQIPGKLMHITASENYIWGVSTEHEIFMMKNSPDESSWTKVDGALCQIDANDYEVWGVTSNGEIFKRPVDGSGAWIKIEGVLKYVSASGNGWIWGVNTKNEIFKRKKSSGDKWERVDGLLKQIDGGFTFVYGVNSDNEIWTRPVDGEKFQVN